MNRFNNVERFPYAQSYLSPGEDDRPRFSLFNDKDGKTFGDHLRDLFQNLKNIPGKLSQWITGLADEFRDFYAVRGELIADVLESVGQVIMDGTVSGEFIEAVIKKLSPKWGEPALEWVRAFLPKAIKWLNGLPDVVDSIEEDIKDLIENFDSSDNSDAVLTDLGVSLLQVDAIESSETFPANFSVSTDEARQLVIWARKAKA